MPSVYIVVPEAERQVARSAAQPGGGSRLSDVVPSGLIQHIEIDSQEKSVTVFLKPGADEASGPVARLGQMIRERFGRECTVLCRRFSLRDGSAVGRWLGANWDAVINEVCRSVPAASGWLRAARWDARGAGLVVKLPNSMGVEILSSRRCDEAIAGIIRERTGCRLSVHFEESQEAAFDHIIREDEPPPPAPSLASADSKAPPPSKASSSGKASGNGGPVLLGKLIADDPRPISDIIHEEPKVVIAGEVFSVETKELKTGRNLTTIELTDYTDSITVKCFSKKEKEATGLEGIAPGTYIKVRGSVRYDKFDKELILSATDVSLSEKPKPRADTAPEKRVELHLHTKMSAMDAVSDIADIVARAAYWGHPAVAVTDHGVVQAFPDAHDAALKHGVKIIYGMEGYLVADERRESGSPAEEAQAAPGSEDEEGGSYHIILLARNAQGLFNLYKLVSASHLEHFYRVPRLPRSLIAKYRDGLIVGSACEAGEVYRAVAQGKSEEELRSVASFYDYLEIQPVANNMFMVREGLVRSVEELRARNLKIYELGKALGKPVVATCDVHFLDPRDEILRRILKAGQGFKDADQPVELYYRTTDEMLEEFSYLGEDAAYEVVVKNPRAIADQCEVLKPVPDDRNPPEMPGAEEEISNMSYSRARELYGDPLPEIVSARLEKELNSIITNGFAVIYLIAHKLVKKSLDDGYLVGSRGSVGSSLVATMCNITEVNPLPPHYLCPSCRYSEFVTDGSVGTGFDLPDKDCPVCGARLKKDGQDIPFEVFLGFKGDKTPDIDLNFSGEYQGRIHKYCEELFGRDNVFRAGTIATVAEKTAYGFVKAYADERNLPMRNAEINRLVKGITGVKRTTGQHPGGLMIVPKSKDIHQFSPVQHPANDKESDTITTHFDYKSISERLLKLDLLGHDDPTTIRMLQDITGIDPKSIPLDDPDTMAIFSGLDSLHLKAEDLGSTVGTLGIPEFGTKFVRQMLEDTRPKTFAELVRISGLSHGTDVWLNNAQDYIRAGVAKLSEVISVRDDIMNYLIQKGMDPSVSFKIMEKVRKGKGLSPEDEAAMRAANVPEWYVESCNKIKYMFPKAHASAYVMMAFRIAWFKVHLPLAFYATYFSVKADEFEHSLVGLDVEALRRRFAEIEGRPDASAKDKNLATIIEVLIEARLRGVEFLPVDLYRSQPTGFAIEGNALRVPFVSIPGLGRAVAESIAAAREAGPFTSIEDLRARTRLTKALVDALRNEGALRGLPETDQLSLFGV